MCTPGRNFSGQASDFRRAVQPEQRSSPCDVACTRHPRLDSTVASGPSRQHDVGRPLTDIPTRVALKKVDRVRLLDGRTSLRSSSTMFWGKVRPKLPDQENSRGSLRSRPRACNRKRRGCRSTRYSNIIVNRGTLDAGNGGAARAYCSERLLPTKSVQKEAST